MNSRLHNHVCDLARGTRGGFAAKLAEAWLSADSVNQAVLNKAFPHIFKAQQPGFHEYKDFVRELAETGMPVPDCDYAQALCDWVDRAKELADSETLP